MDQQQACSASSLITIALMIKNESTSIQATLASIANGGIRDFFILDTGSTDNTIELAAAFFKQSQLNGVIKQEPFIDFATSRNRTLELAEEHFSQTTFFLMPDAEWDLHNAHELIAFCERMKSATTPLYLITIKLNELEFTTARLFRRESQVRFSGVVHEAPTIVAQVKVPAPVYFQVNASEKGVEKTKQRWRRDLELLLKAHQSNAADPRTAFYLAQTYECLHDLPNAYRYYQHRATINGWDEENFATLMRLGNLTLQLKPANILANWAIAMDYFLKAFSIRPHRIEPLVRLADHYWPHNIQACYLYIRYAYDQPYPHNDLLFIDKEAYEYTRYEIMSRCAWYMNEYALGKEATLLALKKYPHVEHLQKNLALYQQKLNSQFITNEGERAYE